MVFVSATSSMRAGNEVWRGDTLERGPKPRPRPWEKEDPWTLEKVGPMPIFTRLIKNSSQSKNIQIRHFWSQI